MSQNGAGALESRSTAQLQPCGCSCSHHHSGTTDNVLKGDCFGWWLCRLGEVNGESDEKVRLIGRCTVTHGRR
jgi:hypothetical protein